MPGAHEPQGPRLEAPEDDDAPGTTERPDLEAQQLSLRQMYSRGVPLYTKHTMKQLKDQIDSVKSTAEDATGPARHRNFAFTSVTGRRVERPVQQGLTGLSQYGDGIVVPLEPCLSYTTYQALLNDSRFPGRALCPVSICYGRSYTGERHSSLEDTRREFEAHRQRWEASRGCQDLRARLGAALAAPGHPPVTRVIAFACSSVSSEGRARRRIATQHALVLTLRDVVQQAQQQQRRPAAVDCLAQDPGYSGVDRALLAGLGVSVVEDPQGFLRVDDGSLVVSFSPNVPVRQIVADLARPAVLAWDTVLTEEQTRARWGRPAAAVVPPRGGGRPGPGVEDIEAKLCDPESSRVRAMIRDEYLKAGDLDPEAFGDASIYVRRRGCGT